MSAIWHFLNTSLALQILNLVALALAVWQMRQARSQTDDLKEIRASLSTRYLGEFPVYLSEIAGVVEEARGRLDIVCDVPAYGCLSDPRGWRLYCNALQRGHSAGVRVTLICLDKPQLRELWRRQFAKTHDDWDGWKASKAANLSALLRTAGDNRSVAEISFQDFLGILELVNERMLTESFAGATIKRVATAIPVCSWIADSTRTVFTMTTYTDEAIEHAFRTVDGKFIAALRDMQLGYQSDLPAVQPPGQLPSA